MDLITTHINAEFDSFASMVAARRFYPEAVMVFPGAQERNLRLFLEAYPHQYRFRRLRSLNLEKVSRLILVDTRRADRIGKVAEILGRGGLEVHVYDHHPPSPHDVRGTFELVEEVGANTTLMVEQLQKRQMRITPAEATAFGLGIYEDTGSLSFISTTARDVRAAAYLLECGLDLRVVSDYVSRELTPEQISLLDDLLHSREFIDAGGISVAVATASRDHFVGDLAVLGHKMKDIENLNALFILVEMQDRVLLVARSRLEAVDAGEIAAAMGGGGHPTAASAVIRQGSLDEVKEKLVEVIRQKVKPVYLARDLMSTGLKVLPASSPIAEASEIMARFGIDHLPVMEGGRLAGIMHREAVERAMRHGLGERPAADFMTADFETLAPDDTYFRIQDLFLNRGQHFIPVLEKGRLAGAVTRSDLLGVLREEAFARPGYRVGPGGGGAIKTSRNVSGIIEERLPPAVVSVIRALGDTARRIGINIYLVGGFVRDLLLGVPNLDLDVVVEGDGIGFARAAAARLGGRVRSHRKFETAVVILPDGFKIDVATSRMEYYEQPGALPKVEHGSIKMDLFRRDFTINALAIQANEADFGRLIDFFGGQKDLEEGVVRVLHDLSFVDDPTRIFRAVRFESRLNFAISEHTLKLMADAVRSNLLESIAGTRLLGEMEGILRERDPLAALVRLQELDLLRAVHPALAGAPVDQALVDRLTKLRPACLDRLREGLEYWLLYLAALVRQSSLEEMSALMRRLGLPPRPAHLLERIWLGHRELAALLAPASMTPAEVHHAVSPFPPEVVCFTMACYQGTPVARRLEEQLEASRSVKPLLRGEDLKRLGYVEGPVYKRILQGLMDAQLNGEIGGREAAIAWTLSHFPPEKDEHGSD